MLLRISAAMAACAFVHAAFAETAEQFFEGKQLKIIVGYGPGTGNDIYTRHVAKHIGRFMPGAPSVATVNMPGAASLAMLNYLYNVAPRDGTVIGMPSRNLLTEPLLGNEQAKFEALKLNYVGSVNRETGLCSMWRASGVSTLEDAKKAEIPVGSTGAFSVASVFPKILNKLFGTRFKPVLGYPDSAAIGMAMETGEVKGYCSFPLSAIRSARPQWLTLKQINILLQLTTRAHPDLPDTPLVMDLAQTDEQKQTLTFVFADQEMGRPVAAPPGAPADRVAIWRRAFEAMTRDRDYIEEAQKIGLDIEGPLDGAGVEAIMRQLYDTPAGVVATVRSVREQP